MRIRKDKYKAKCVSENLFDDALVYDWKNDSEEAVVSSELRSTLEYGLDILSPDLRAAVVLRNVSIVSLKSRLHRARILLRKHLDEYSSLALLPPPTPTLNPS